MEVALFTERLESEEIRRADAVLIRVCHSVDIRSFWQIKSSSSSWIHDIIVVKVKIVYNESSVKGSWNTRQWYNK